jgi:mevalonate kinase
MTISFAYSVPTKVILFGEHAVVHGHPAIAMAINNRMLMTGTIAASRIPEVQIRFNKSTFTFNPTDPIPPSAPPLHQMYRTALSPHFPAFHRLSLTFSIARECSGGLGSSAALSVLVAAAARRIARLPFSPPDLFDPAKRLECFFHSNSSGLDVATVLAGAAVSFRRSEFAPIPVPEIPLLIVDTKVPRQTGAAVNRVRDFLEREPERAGALLTELGNLADKFGRAPDDRKERFAADNFGAAQTRLAALGVSCPEIDAIVGRATEAGLAAKLSGAGMGGIVIVTGPRVFEKEALFDPFVHFRACADLVGLREEKFTKTGLIV